MTTIDAPEVSWEEAMRREKFWNDNYEWLLANYREQYVAVDPNDGSVVASNEELVFLINELKRCGFHPPRDVAVRLVSDRFHTMIL